MRSFNKKIILGAFFCEKFLIKLKRAKVGNQIDTVFFFTHTLTYTKKKLATHGIFHYLLNDS